VKCGNRVLGNVRRLHPHEPEAAGATIPAIDDNFRRQDGAERFEYLS